VTEEMPGCWRLVRNERKACQAPAGARATERAPEEFVYLF